LSGKILRGDARTGLNNHGKNLGDTGGDTRKKIEQCRG